MGLELLLHSHELRLLVMKYLNLLLLEALSGLILTFECLFDFQNSDLLLSQLLVQLLDFELALTRGVRGFDQLTGHLSCLRLECLQLGCQALLFILFLLQPLIRLQQQLLVLLLLCKHVLLQLRLDGLYLLLVITFLELNFLLQLHRFPHRLF